MPRSNQNQQNNYLSTFIPFLFGLLVMYTYSNIIKDKSSTASKTPVSKSIHADSSIITYSAAYAKLNKVNGLYVFIESYPLNSKGYQVLGSIEGENLIDAVNGIGIGKEKFGKVLENIFNKTSENANFRAQLETMTELVKEKYPDAQGLIFSNRIKKCEVIVFD